MESTAERAYVAWVGAIFLDASRRAKEGLESSRDTRAQDTSVPGRGEERRGEACYLCDPGSELPPFGVREKTGEKEIGRKKEKKKKKKRGRERERYHSSSIQQ